MLMSNDRVVEAILIAIVTTASVFIVATFLGTCVRENTLTDTSDCPGFVSNKKKKCCATHSSSQFYSY